MLVNWYIQVWSEYVPVHTSMYHNHWYISENAFLCPMTVGNNTLYAWHACCGIPTLNKCPYLCPKCMTLFWYILSTYQYVLWSFICKSTYRYVLVCTSTNQVHTKNTVLVQLVTIPDGRGRAHRQRSWWKHGWRQRGLPRWTRYIFHDISQIQHLELHILHICLLSTYYTYLTYRSSHVWTCTST